MTKPHKHAQILKAIADGLPMQSKDFDGWIDCTAETAMVRISMDMPTRIKTKPNPDVIQNYHITKAQGHFSTGADSCPPKEYKEPNIALTFDGETGKLKSAEVLK